MKTDAYNRQQHLKLLFRTKQFNKCHVFIATHPKDVALKTVFEKLSDNVERELIKEERAETRCRNSHVKQMSFMLKKVSVNPSRYPDRVALAETYAEENGVQNELEQILKEKEEWFATNIANSKQSALPVAPATSAKFLKSKRELVKQLEELIASGKKLASCLFAKENDMEGRLPAHWQPEKKEGKVSNKVRANRLKHSSARCNHGNMDAKDRKGHGRKPVATRKRREK